VCERERGEGDRGERDHVRYDAQISYYMSYVLCQAGCLQPSTMQLFEQDVAFHKQMYAALTPPLPLIPLPLTPTPPPYSHSPPLLPLPSPLSDSGAVAIALGLLSSVALPLPTPHNVTNVTHGEEEREGDRTLTGEAEREEEEEGERDEGVNRQSKIRVVREGLKHLFVECPEIGVMSQRVMQIVYGGEWEEGKRADRQVCGEMMCWCAAAEWRPAAASANHLERLISIWCVRLCVCVSV
jgi:hypothetical protein